MDGLDALMAELSSSSKPVPASSNKTSSGGDATKDVSKQRQARASSLGQAAPPGRRDLDRDLPERVVYFIDRLKRFQIRAADPSTRQELNQRLSEKSQDYTFTMQVNPSLVPVRAGCLSRCFSAVLLRPARVG